MSKGHQCRYLHCHNKVWRVRSVFCSEQCRVKATVLRWRLKRMKERL